VASTLERIANAIRWRAQQALDRFARPAEYAANQRPEYIQLSYAQALGGDVPGGKRPPTGEIPDIPISLWTAWSVQTIKAATNSFVIGTFGQSALLTEAMLADDRIQAATNGRIKGVTKCAVTMQPSLIGNKRKTAKVAKELEAIWPELFPEAVLEQLLFWAIFMGFALCEIIWETRNDRWMPRLKVWHPLYIYYDIQLRQYVAITMDGPVWVKENDPKWFLFAPWGAYRGWMRGAVRSCAIPWIVRQFALRDWARYSEVHGLPTRVAKVPAQAPAEDKARFFAAVRNLGAETSLLLPVQAGKDSASWDMMLLEASDRSWQSFKGLRDCCDESITLAIRGTNLTTSVKGGSFAAAKVHKDEDSDYAESDVKKLAAAAKSQLLTYFCLYNYGDANLAPLPILAATPEEDKKATADTMLSVSESVTALEQQNWPIDRVAIADKYDIPLREGEDPGVAPKPTPKADGSPEPSEANTPDRVSKPIADDESDIAQTDES
jgi:phage gp29-like protein